MLDLPTAVRPRILTVAVLLLVGCAGGGENEPPAKGGDTAASVQPSGAGPCALLLQGEVDELFGASVGAGLDEDLGEGTTLCTWPASTEPRLLLQIGPASDDIRAAVDLGEGYRVVELTNLSGPAAVALFGPGGGSPSVAVLALTSGEKTLVVSPIGLDVSESSPRYERFLAIVGAAAGRL